MPKVWRYFLTLILFTHAVATADTLEAGKYRVFGFDVDYGKTYSVFLSVNDADCDLYAKEGATWPPPSGEAPTKANYWAGYASTHYLTLDESFTFTAVRDDFLWVSIYAVPLHGTCGYDHIDALGHVAVASLSASAITRDSAQVQWEAAFSADHYEYQYGLNGGLFGATHQTTNTQVQLTGLTAERNYDFRVRACNQYGNCTAWAHAHEGTGYLFRTLNANQPPRPVSNPAPAHQAINQATWTALTWNGNGDPDGDAVRYKVYLGTSSTLGAEQYQGIQSSTVFNPPGNLQPGTRYFWRIDSFDGELTTPGPVWSFFTQAANRPPAPVTNPRPADQSINMPTQITLAWAGNGDADGDPVQYQVYFGTDSSPDASEYLGTTTDLQWNLPQTLAADTTYYWRVDSHDGELTTPGPVWRFTTGAGRHAQMSLTDTLVLKSQGDGQVRVEVTDGRQVPYVLYLKRYDSLAALRANPLLGSRVSELPPDQILLSNGRNEFKTLSLGPKPLVALALEGNDRLPDGYYRIAHAWGRHMVLNLNPNLLPTGTLYCGSQSLLEFFVGQAEDANLTIIDTLGELSREAFDGVALDLVLQALPEEYTGLDFSLISELCDNPNGVATLINNLLDLPGGEHYAFGQWLDRLLYDLADQYALVEPELDSSALLARLATEQMSQASASGLKVVAYYLALRINTYTDVLRFLWDAWKPPVMGEHAFAIIGGELYDVDAGSQPQPLALIHSQIAQTTTGVALTLDASNSRIPADHLGVDYTWILRDALGNTLDSAQGERALFTFDQGQKLWVTLILDVFQPERQTSVAVTKIVIPDPLPAFDFTLEAHATDIPGQYRIQVRFLEGMTAAQVQRISYDFGDGTRVTDFASEGMPLTLSQTHAYGANGTYWVAVAFIADDGRMGQIGLRLDVNDLPPSNPPPPDDGGNPPPPPPNDGSGDGGDSNTTPPPPSGDGGNPPPPPPDDNSGNNDGGGTDDSPPPSVDDPNDSRPPPPNDGTGDDNGVPPPASMAAPSASDGTWFGQIVVQWPAQENATQYHLLRCGDATLLSSCQHLVGQQSTRYDDREVDGQTRYYYRVYACNAAGCARPSPADTGWAAPLPAPETPCRGDNGEIGLLEHFSGGHYQCLSQEILILAPVVESGTELQLQAPEIALRGGFRVERGAVVRLVTTGL